MFTGVNICLFPGQPQRSRRRRREGTSKQNGTPKFKEVCLVDALGRIATRSPTLLMGLSWPLLRGTNSCANGRALALIYYLEHFALYRFLTVNPTFFLNTCFTAARPKLRRSVAHVVRIDKHNDGQYILCYNKHFVAFRILDGDAEINFTHKSHAWKKCWVSSCVTKPVEFHANLGAYVVDESLLDGLFRICSACHLPAPAEAPAVLRKLQFLNGSAGP